jgi:hypothetical protein
MYATSSKMQPAKTFHLGPKILATKWQMDISKDGNWKPQASNSSILSVLKMSKSIAARKSHQAT